MLMKNGKASTSGRPKRKSAKPISEVPKAKRRPRIESILDTAMMEMGKRLADPKNKYPAWLKKAQRHRKELGN
jgi:hypothetical protein